VEAPWCASHQKSAQESFKNQDHANWFFGIRGVVHHEYVPAGQTVNAKFYVEFLKCLRERVRRARSELWAENAWILHQDNASSHTTLVMREFLAKTKSLPWTTLPIRLTWHPATSTCSLKWKISFGMNIIRCWYHQTRNDEAPKGTDKGGHAALLSRMGEVLDQVHSVTGSVLRGWPHPRSRII
jgi:hypothetical protein